MNILYLADINSIHDFKWMTYFGNLPDFKVYVTSEKEEFQKLSRETRRKLKNAGIEILPGVNNFSFAKPFATIQTVLKLRTYIKDYNIQIVHALFGSPQPIWFNFLPKNLKRFITTRGSDVLVMLKQLHEQPTRKTDKLMKFLLMKAFGSSDIITSTSKKQIDYLTQIGINPEKSHLIKTGVDVEALQAVQPEENVWTSKSKYIFSARYIGEVYNMDYQLEAIKKVPQNFLKEYSFLFVKKQGEKGHFVKNFITQLESIPHLTFDIIEGVSQKEMWTIIKGASITYMVPKSDGTPNTALECMALEAPFIMGDLDYNKELFEKVSLVAKLDDSTSFAQALLEGVINYPSELLTNGFEKVCKFGDRSTEMEKLKKLYLAQNV